MRKNLLFTVLTIFTLSNAMMAQNIIDDFESYDLGVIGPQSEHWTTWSGAEGPNIGEEAEVTDAQAASGNKSLYIDDSQVTDVILLLGNVDCGHFDLSWNVFVPDEKLGYYNIQDDENPGVQWNIEVYFGVVEGVAIPGSAQVVINSVVVETFEYPVGEWFALKHDIDLDNDLMQVFVNDERVYEMDYTDMKIGGANFYSSDPDFNEMYIDDVSFTSIGDPLTVDFSVDLAFEADIAEPVNLIGDFSNWEPVAMSDADGDGIWTTSVELGSGSTYQYNFVNGPSSDEAELLSDECGSDNGEFGLSRTVEVECESIVLDTVCYNECSDCLTANAVDLHLKVDMQFEEISPVGVYVLGDFDALILILDLFHRSCILLH